MLGNYAKRRSTQRPSVTQPPQSPQFGDVPPHLDHGDNVSSRRGGGTGSFDDDDPRSNDRSPSAKATPFDERVKSVRSRIREMVSVAGEDSSDASDCNEMNPMRKASMTSRGSKTSNARQSASKAAASGKESCAPKKQPKQKSITSSVVEENSVALANASMLGSRSAEAVVSSSPSRKADDSGRLVGRDDAAYVGARVRVLDPKAARYVDPTGVVVEVRCEGERVRVEHDGPEKAQRYYNTGKNGEFQLEFCGVDPGRNRRLPPTVADSSDEEVTPAPAPKPKAKAATKKGIPRGSRSSKVLASPLDEDVDDLEINAAVKKASRYSQIREKRQSTCQELGSPVVASTASSSTALTTSKANVSSPRPESSPDPEARAKIPYSQRRSMRFSQAEVAAVVAKVTDSAEVNAPSPANLESTFGDMSTILSLSTSEKPKVPVSSNSLPDKDTCSSGLHGQSAEVGQLRKDHDDLLLRLSNLEQTFVKDLGAVQEDVHRQIETTEKRIVARVLEELEKRLRQATKTALSEPVKPAKLSMDVISSQEPPQQGVGTPTNYEPEQEYAESDLSECPASSSRRPSELHKPYLDEALQKVNQRLATDVSTAELVENSQRLENIGNVARRITGSFSGGSNPAPIKQMAIRQENDGSQTPDFAAPSFSGSPSQNFPTPESLDAEMARLAEMRRFASNVMKAAEVQSQFVSNTATSTLPAWTDSAQHGWVGSSLPGPPPLEAQSYGSSHQMGMRDVANYPDRQGPPHFESTDMERFRMNPGGSGRKSMPAQMPGVPPWAENSPREHPQWDSHSNTPAYSPRGVGPQACQTHQLQADSKQPFFRAGKGARHSFAQPMRPSWPAASNRPPGNEWDCTPAESEGRLVF